MKRATSGLITSGRKNWLNNKLETDYEFIVSKLYLRLLMDECGWERVIIMIKQIVLFIFKYILFLIISMLALVFILCSIDNELLTNIGISFVILCDIIVFASWKIIDKKKERGLVLWKRKRLLLIIILILLMLI